MRDILKIRSFRSSMVFLLDCIAAIVMGAIYSLTSWIINMYILAYLFNLLGAPSHLGLLFYSLWFCMPISAIAGFVITLTTILKNRETKIKIIIKQVTSSYFFAFLAMFFTQTVFYPLSNFLEARFILSAILLIIIFLLLWVYKNTKRSQQLYNSPLTN